MIFIESTMNQNVKMAVPLLDGSRVEAVCYGSGTLCISSQVGCALRCSFCASGAHGLLRNLHVDELEWQVEFTRRNGLNPRRITVSGIGEPLHNPREVMAFLHRTRAKGLPVSLTTTGAPTQHLPSFLLAPHNGLMLSLHAGTPAMHKRLIPNGPSFESLWAVLATIWPQLSRRRRRKIGINYLMLAGVNSSRDEIAALAARLKRFPEVTVHLLLPNAVEGSPYREPSEELVLSAAELLVEEGLNVRQANRWRRQSTGGCGTLVAEKNDFMGV